MMRGHRGQGKVRLLKTWQVYRILDVGCRRNPEVCCRNWREKVTVVGSLFSVTNKTVGGMVRYLSEKDQNCNKRMIDRYKNFLKIVRLQ